MTEGDYHKTKMNYEMNPIIIFQFQSTIENKRNHYGYQTFRFSIHSPNIIPWVKKIIFILLFHLALAPWYYFSTTLDADYFDMTDNGDKVFWDIRFVKQESSLKPYPFKTNCREYNKDNAIGEISYQCDLVRFANLRTPYV